MLLDSFVRRRWIFFAALAFMGAVGHPADAASHKPVRGTHGMVVSADRRASEVGVKILQRGGNAIDAAVAVGFALSVVYPEAGNIGGGGFMLVRLHDGKSYVVDFREKASRHATPGMYVDSSGKLSDNSLNGPLSCGVPGTVAGFVLASERYGKLKFSELVQPSIELAKSGAIIDDRFAGVLAVYRDSLIKYSSTRKVYFPHDALLKQGDTLRLPELAATLERIQQSGLDGFYKGETARLIVEEIRRGGGMMDQEDLDSYKAVIREPLKGTYRGYDIITVPPPSSGGAGLLEMLNIVERFNLHESGFHSSQSVHIMAEAMERMHADRAEFLGDPDFFNVPVNEIISKDYAQRLALQIDSLNATPGKSIHHGAINVKEGNNTTHYAVIDSEGNIAAVTYTLNDLFGSKVVVDGAGFFLNDEMDDFSAQPGVPNAYGLIGGEANAISPGKRPLSSMVPAIVLKNGAPYLILGARGGPRIITAIFETIVDVIDYGMNIQEAVDAPRFYHEWTPDTLQYERFGFPRDVEQNLRSRGYSLKEVWYSLGQLEAIMVNPLNRIYEGASDPREGGTAVGY
jgi:gamma-glutamyltranspeptidase/glutathione hydrolase